MASVTQSSNDPVGLKVVTPPTGPPTREPSIHNARQLADISLSPGDGFGEITIPAAAQTFDGFRAWAVSDAFPDRGKLSFIAGGLIVDMSPESMEEHSDVKTEICRVLSALVRERKLGRLHIDGVLVTVPAAGVANEPDALFLSRETIQSGRLTFTPEKGRPQSSKEIVGPVDWVLEIVSPSSRRKDTVELREAYFKAGIPEYWLIDVLEDDIRFEILVPASDGYAAVAPVDGFLASPVFGRAFQLTREKEEDGFWQYTLHMQEKS